MFFNRLKWFTVMISALAILIVIRLIDVQIVRAAEFERYADDMLTRAPRMMNAPRGAILDREGTPLLRDKPCSDVSLHYALLRAIALHEGPLPDSYQAYPPPVPREPDAFSPLRDYVRAIAHREIRDGQHRGVDRTQVYERVAARFSNLWQSLPRLTGVPRDTLRDTAQRIDRRVQAVKRYVLKHNQNASAVREERQLHPLVENLPTQAALQLRVSIGDKPWIQVRPSSYRENLAHPSLSHLLGRLGAANTRRIDEDVYSDLNAPEEELPDEQLERELRQLMSGDRCGISGVERLCELELRGIRGVVPLKLDGSLDIDRRRDPTQGQDVRLTIDADLQQAAYQIVAEGVANSPNPCGGAAVVIDASTREILALVSYPTYEAANFRKDYNRLRADLPGEPLRFRAIANGYPPGSTCKVVTLYGALHDGKLTPTSHVTCDGPFRDDLPDKFRCWIYNKHRANHGPVDAAQAIEDSCNPYFYTAGDRLGPLRLTEWFRTFGMGATQGTGLIEEARGLVPTNNWMARRRPSRPKLVPADAWNFSIGQGEINATPLQAANVAATMATGRWEPVRLLLNNNGTARPSALPAEPKVFDESQLRVIRSGMQRVVSEGTAKVARLKTPGYELCGKTGSAQTVAKPILNRWVFKDPEGFEHEFIEPYHLTQSEVLKRTGRDDLTFHMRRTYERYPQQALRDLFAHAWFIGYTQSKATPDGAPARGRSYAIAVVIEYGESGGEQAGPVARDIADYLLSREQEWGRLTPSPGGR